MEGYERKLVLNFGRKKDLTSDMKKNLQKKKQNKFTLRYLVMLIGDATYHFNPLHLLTAIIYFSLFRQLFLFY